MRPDTSQKGPSRSFRPINLNTISNRTVCPKKSVFSGSERRNMKVHPEQPWAIRPVQAAALLGISRSKLYSLMARQEIPTIRVGKSLRVPVSALQRWFERQTKIPDSREIGTKASIA